MSSNRYGMDSRLFWVSLNGGKTWRHVSEGEYANMQQLAGFGASTQRPTFRKGIVAGSMLRPDKAVIRYDKVLG